jgi:hypothetical protein
MDATPEGVCNLALRRIAHPYPIGFIYEGSPAARVALEIYGQTRDELLRGSDWDFARQAVGLTMLKTAPAGGYGFMNPWTNAYPPPPWVYEYAYPSGALMIRSVRPTPIVMPEYDPQPNVFVLGNDNSLSPPAKVILTNLAGAQAVYTAQVTDPTQWNVQFTEALVSALATRFQLALAPSAEADKDREQEEAQETTIAVPRRG